MVDLRRGMQSQNVEAIQQIRVVGIVWKIT
jgi:hypothetical protein